MYPRRKRRTKIGKGNTIDKDDSEENNVDSENGIRKPQFSSNAVASESFDGLLEELVQKSGII